MCFIEKMNYIRIRKRDDRVSDPVRTPGRVESGTGARASDTKMSIDSKLIINIKLTTPKPSLLKFSRIFNYTKSNLF